MLKFQFRAHAPDGKIVRGVVEAATRLDAARLISKNGQKLLELNEDSGPVTGVLKFWAGTPSRGSVDFHHLFSQLSILLQAGFTIDAGLKAIASGQKKKSGLSEVVAAIGSGSSFSEAIAKIQGANPAVVALLVSGEHSGRLDEVVSVLATMFDEDKKRKTEALEAILYPVFLLVMMLLAIGIIMFALVPAIDPVFEGLAEQKPILISVLASIRLFILSYGWTIVGAILSTGIILAYTAQSMVGKEIITFFWLKTPFIGRLSGARGSARYLHVLGMLLSNSVPIKKALELAAMSCPITAYRARMLEIKEQVTTGVPFRRAARDAKLFDKTSLSLIDVGDEANKLPEALKRAAFLVEIETGRDIRRMLAFLTPFMTVVMGAVIGSIVVSVMDALLSINDLAVQ